MVESFGTKWLDKEKIINSLKLNLIFIQTTKGPTIDADIYTKRCLPKLMKFIKDYIVYDNYSFFLDYSSSYHGNKTIDLLNKHKATFVSKRSQSI